MSMTSLVTLTTFSRHSGPSKILLQIVGKLDFMLDLRACNSVMASPIDLKFSGGILDRTGFLARGLLERGRTYIV